jgi:mRNA interferase MazF
VVAVSLKKFNLSRIGTVVCVPLTSNLRWAEAPGNVVLPAQATGLSKDSVASVSQLVTLDRGVLDEHVVKLSRLRVEAILSGIDVVLGR